ncbi:MAG TPA: cohesin domain-containing protein [bacterium]|nr:cohesin domain-containing protein [bacterium]
MRKVSKISTFFIVALCPMVVLPGLAGAQVSLSSTVTELDPGGTLPVTVSLTGPTGITVLELDLTVAGTLSIPEQNAFVPSQTLTDASTGGTPFTNVMFLPDNGLRISVALMGDIPGVNASSQITLGTLNVIATTGGETVTLTPRRIAFDFENNNMGVTMGSGVSATVTGGVVLDYDVDDSGQVDVDDVVSLFDNIFAGNALLTWDFDASGATDVDDVVFLFDYIFAGGGGKGAPKEALIASANQDGFFDFFQLAQSPELTISGDLEGAPGEQVTINVNISDGTNIRGFQVDLNFDPAVLSVVSSVIGPSLSALDIESAAVVSDGVFRMMGAGLVTSMPAGPGTVVTVTFAINGNAPSGPTALSFLVTKPTGLVAPGGQITVVTAQPDTPTPTNTPLPTATPESPTATPVETPTATPTRTPTNTAVPTNTPTNTPTLQPTESPTATPVETPTATPVPTNTPTRTPTVTAQPTESPTATPVETPTATPVETPTATPVPTSTPTRTPTATAKPTESPTATPVETPTATPVETPTATPIPTSTPTLVPTSTPTLVPTPTLPPTATPTPGIALFVPFSTEGLIWAAGYTVNVDFTYTNGGPLTVNIGDFGAELDPAGTLILPDGRQISDDDGGEGDDAMIVLQNAPAGKYRLIVRGQGGTFGRFSVSAVPEVIGEPTTMISFGQRVEGRIANLTDLHLFTFYAQIGDFIKVALTDVGSALDPFLTLQGPDGFTSMMDNDSGPDDDALIIVGPATIAGIYTIGVSPAPATTGLGQYALILASNVINDRLIAAGEMVSGSISLAGQVDRYVFTNAGGGEITFYLDDFDPLFNAGGTLDPFLRLLNGAGEQAATDSNSGLNDDAYVTTTLTAGTIEVSGGPDDMTLGPYRLEYRIGAYVPPTLKAGSGNETYVYASQSEWYSFSGTAGQLVTIGVDDFKGSLDPAVRLYGPDGTVLATSLNAFPAPEDDAQIRLFPLPATGFYKVEVFGENKTFGKARITFQKL